MKPEELMIGDWVYNAHHKRNIRITAYDFFMHGHCKDGSQFIASMGLPALGRDLEPIPLTPEILEKNSFEALDKFCWYRDGDSVVYYYPETGELVVLLGLKKVFYLPIHNVHELQHALKLCGIEKEIKV